MRKKMNTQMQFNFQPSNLKITKQYFGRYEAISRILDEHPEIIDLVHRDLKKVLKRQKDSRAGHPCNIATDSVLRILISQIFEGETLRGTVIRVDADNNLRWFTRIYNDEMINFTTLCTFKNAIRPKTWKKINELLTQAAVEADLISGDRLRADTTAGETNIHWPTDSGLLWDTYRVICRLINTVREIDPEVASDRRLHAKRVKRIHTKIARRSGKKQSVSKEAKQLYERLIGHVERLLDCVPSICKELRKGLKQGLYGFMETYVVEGVIAQIEHFHSLGLKVVDQARRRVLRGEQVANEEKIFSIFEPHTELLKRGKAGKPIEFGHMIFIQQVEGKFITDYKVFKKKPIDHTLVDPALESHRELFGENPREFSADKGFYESMDKIRELEEEIEVVSIAKKGSRTEDEEYREISEPFRLGQRFRAGIEGSISFLKRSLGMRRCMNKGWEHYVSTLAAIVFVHNLLVFAGARR